MNATIENVQTDHTDIHHDELSSRLRKKSVPSICPMRTAQSHRFLLLQEIVHSFADFRLFAAMSAVAAVTVQF